MKKIQKFCSAVSISVRLKFREPPTRIHFSCTEMSNYQRCDSGPQNRCSLSSQLWAVAKTAFLGAAIAAAI